MKSAAETLVGSAARSLLYMELSRRPSFLRRLHARLLSRAYLPLLAHFDVLLLNDFGAASGAQKQPGGAESYERYY